MEGRKSNITSTKQLNSADKDKTSDKSPHSKVDYQPIDASKTNIIKKEETDNDYNTEKTERRNKNKKRHAN